LLQQYDLLFFGHLYNQFTQLGGYIIADKLL
jgi:hypothetical protein